MQKTDDDISLVQKDSVVYMILKFPKANNFNPHSLKKINEYLDLVEQNKTAKVLVTISAIPKYYSTGLDLKYVQKIKSFDEFGLFIEDFSKLLGRMLVFPLPTIAIINGICMAGGFTFALAHDYRFMTTDDKAFVCLNEVDMGTTLPHAMNACAKCKLTNDTYRDIALFGRRVGPKEALQRNVVDFCCTRDEAKDKVHEFALKVPVPKSREDFKALKLQTYAEEYKICTEKTIYAEEVESTKAFLQFSSRM